MVDHNQKGVALGASQFLYTFVYFRASSNLSAATGITGITGITTLVFVTTTQLSNRF